MGYSLRKVWVMIRRHKLIYFLLILEMTVGMCMYVYSCNLSASIQKEEESLKQEDAGYLLRISEKAGQDRTKQAPVDYRDYESIQFQTDRTTELYVEMPDIMIAGGEIIDYNLLLLDFEDYNLNNSYAYIGERIPADTGKGEIIFGNEKISLEQDKLSLQMAENQSKEFQVRKMPASLENTTLKFLTTDSGVALSSCILLPITKMDTIYGALQPETAQYELRIRREGIPDEENVLEEILHNLNKKHGESYSYEFYSPVEELKNNTYKTKWDINALHKTGILLLCTLFTASISIFRILLGQREQEIGICQACGAAIGVIAAEIFEEILIVSLTGTVIGCAAGAFLTCNLTSFLAGMVKMSVHLSAFIQSFLICILIVIVVSIATIQKIYSKSIIELIRERS